MVLTIPLVITLAAGAIILLLGRRLFWLYVGILGFIAGFDLAQIYLVDQPEWIYFSVGVGLGFVASFVAIYLQYIAVGIAGFLSGAYLAASVLQHLAIPDASEWAWIALVVAGIVGTLLFMLVFDTALVFLSAIIGAIVLLTPFGLEPPLHYGLLIGLAAVGVIFQLTVLSRESRAS